MSDYPADPGDVRLTIDVTTEPAIDAVVVIPRGEVDLATSDALRVVVDRLIDEGVGAVVLDLSDVGFVDSTALGMLVSFHRRLDAGLIVAAAQPAVLRLLELTKLTSLLRLTDSVAAALATLRPEAPEPS